MEEHSYVILSLIKEFLSFKDVLAMAAINKNLREVITSPGYVRDLAIEFGFPFGLTLVEMKNYSIMYIYKRLRLAARSGDMRLVKRLIELGADNYDQAMINAAWGKL
jgi:hypothetical protein